ncbi:MAG: hypothetical protein AAGH72_13050 [Verrucomicrobiota bacterium]
MPLFSLLNSKSRFHSAVCIGLCIILFSAYPVTASVIPESYDIARYDHLWQNSPFSMATVTLEEGVDATWVLTGISVLDQSPFVSFTNLDTRKSVSLSPGESIDGLKLVHAEWSSNSEQSFAVVDINGAQKKLLFDNKQLAVLASKSAAVPGRPVNPVTQQVKSSTSAQASTPPATVRSNTPATTQNSSSIPRRRIILRR